MSDMPRNRFRAGLETGNTQYGVWLGIPDQSAAEIMAGAGFDWLVIDHEHGAFELRDATIVTVLEKTDAFRRPARFEQYLLACEADARGRTGFEHRDYPQAAHFRAAFEVASNVDAADIANDHDEAEIRGAIRKARVEAVRQYRQKS